MTISLSTVTTLTSSTTSILESSASDVITTTSRRPSKVQFNLDVKVDYTFHADDYDRKPVEPSALTARDYVEYQIISFEMNQIISFELTMRRLGLWEHFAPIVQKNDDPFSLTIPYPVMDSHAGWAPSSESDPLTQALLFHLHGSSQSSGYPVEE